MKFDPNFKKRNADCGRLDKEQRLRLWERLMALRGTGAGEGYRLMAD